MPKYTPRAGYAYYWEGDEKDCPRTQDWETVVLVESELPGLTYRGIRVIDGARCAIFHAGEARGYDRYFAQTAVYCQAKPGACGIA
jgi:hypothetical protein